MIQLGDRARDRISGFEGIVIGISQWLHGCRRISLQPEDLRDGKPMEHHTFDEPQVMLLAERAYEAQDPLRKTGGPSPDIPRRRDEPRR